MYDPQTSIYLASIFPFRNFDKYLISSAVNSYTIS